MTQHTFQSKLDELQQQLSLVQQFSQEDPGQLRELLPVVLAGLQKSLADLQPVVVEGDADAPLPADPNGSADLSGHHDQDPRLARARRFRVMAEWSPGLVRIMGAESRCRWANHSWRDFTGCNRNELLGEGWLEHVHPEDRARCRQACHEAFESNRLYRMEYRLEREGGGYGWILEVGTPRSDSLGGSGGYFGVATEITAQKQLMEDLLLAEERERQRLAVDLQEGLSQTIALTQMKVSALRSAADAKLESSLQEIARLIEQTDQTARLIGFELIPPVLHDLGLVPALEWLIENIRARYDVRIDLVHEPRLASTDERSRMLVFRTIRELLINAAKHAGARHVCVRLRSVAGELQVEVEDDGIGMDRASMAEHGSGLFSIQERMNHVGGGMTIESARGQGTKVRLHVPLAGILEREAGAQT